MGRDEKHGIYLFTVKHTMSIRRLINSLNEYRDKKNTYPEPEKYLEMILSSVANEINKEIEYEKENDKQKRDKEIAKKKESTKARQQNTGK